MCVQCGWEANLICCAYCESHHGMESIIWFNVYVSYKVSFTMTFIKQLHVALHTQAHKSHM